MPTITYHDLDKSCHETVWFGVPFHDGDAVELDDCENLSEEQKAEMLLRASGSPFFETAQTEPPVKAKAKAATAESDNDYKAGHGAAEAGAKRDAHKSAAWLKGFDEAMSDLEDKAAKSKNTHPRR